MSKYKKKLERFGKKFRVMMGLNLYRWTLALSVLLIGLTTALPIWRVLPLAESQPFIPLHYNVYLGIDRFGPVHELFYIPVLAVFILLVNLVLQTHFSKREKLLSTFFAISTPVLEFVLLMGMVLIILVIV